MMIQGFSLYYSLCHFVSFNYFILFFLIKWKIKEGEGGKDGEWAGVKEG